ncbi:MAG: nicotinate phosphoribosyltransferase [Defluviitaleaceae bacterium]|nr:nicotinate phosphoribosyltransferase [Defluviitaleaceae bacterium]
MLNHSLLTDFYQLTMMQGYLHAGMGHNRAVFDMFYRENPSGSGFAIMAGLEQLMDYIENLHFSEEDLDYLRGQGIFSEDFIDYLRNFRFSGDICAIPEGSVVFPNEPLCVVTAPIIEAQLIETALLNILNHQCLIATKAARVCHAAGEDSDMVLEFGARRAQGPDAAIYGARAAVIGGCSATSNVLAGKMFDIPVKGTHAHSWVMSFDTELEAFAAYAAAFPDRCTLLVDTYDTLESGVPNAIRIFDEMRAAGKPLGYYGIRLDSGDFAYLSKEARKMLDAAGHKDAKITASCDLDEFLIQSLKLQGAKIDNWGVGTSLITSKDYPAFGGVYKLVAVESNGKMIPKIKLSENPIKVTVPDVKKIYRIYDAKHHKIKADLITLADETINEAEQLTLFDPKAPWKKMRLAPGEYYARELFVPIIKDGKRVYNSPSIMKIREYSMREQNSLWEEHRRLINPHIMPVDLSQKLYDLKQKMIYGAKNGI